MSFVALGVNHQTASVELREQIAFNPERLKDLFAVESLRQNLNDMVVVSTCNRTEVYAMAENADMVLNWLAQTNGIDVKQLSNHVYRYENTDAVSHLMRVASGLDSLMLGEPPILGQVKTALSHIYWGKYGGTPVLVTLCVGIAHCVKPVTENCLSLKAISLLPQTNDSLPCW